MRFLSIFFAIACLGGTAWPQAADQEPILQGRPDVIVRVRKSTVGADYVEVLMVKENYPEELLKQQCARISEELGAGLRGLVVSSRALGGDPETKAGKVVFASFATDGVIQDSGVLRILPFARAFAGVPGTRHDQDARRRVRRRASRTGRDGPVGSDGFGCRLGGLRPLVAASGVSGRPADTESR
ncbi:MAG: hypothetical protein KatS3mg015_0863 [Fimbriimonadales bacterium]|nr:MAG: hypothetical protein KatS3mg015_0863 [Fimbriimonadales bacterium]